MTGTEFQERIEASEYSQREIADRWGVSHTTIQRECDRDEVRGLYRDAIIRLTKFDGENGPSSPVAEGYYTSDFDRWEPSTLDYFVHSSKSVTSIKFTPFVSYDKDSMAPLWPDQVGEKDWDLGLMPVPVGYLGETWSPPATGSVAPPGTDPHNHEENINPSDPGREQSVCEFPPSGGVNSKEAIKNPLDLNYRQKCDLLVAYMHSFVILDSGDIDDDKAARAICTFSKWDDVVEITSDTKGAIYEVKVPDQNETWNGPDEPFGSNSAGGQPGVDRSDPRSPSQGVVDMYGGDEEQAQAHWCNTH
jgi:hypothetical protein